MAPHPQRLTVTRRAWALARPFTTAQGIQTTTETVVAEISDGDSRGRGEGVPLRRSTARASTTLSPRLMR